VYPCWAFLQVYRLKFCMRYSSVQSMPRASHTWLLILIFGEECQDHYGLLISSQPFFNAICIWGDVWNYYLCSRLCLQLITCLYQHTWRMQSREKRIFVLVSPLQVFYFLLHRRKEYIN
jgi:hypothetical protein